MIFKKFSLSVVIFNVLSAAAFTLSGTVAQAGIHLSLSGAQNDAHAGLQEIKSATGTGSVAFDLGAYLRLGYTFMAQTQSAVGWVKEEDQEVYYTYSSKSLMMSHAVDLTVVLYGGDVFTPYIFGGPARKSYDIETRQENKGIQRDKGSYMSPTGGVGLAIRIAQKFQLKLSQTYSMGAKIYPDQTGESTIDTYSQIGIQYSL